MNKERKPQRKVSIGIALCRRHPETCVPQILLIKSRITYSFSSFVFGKYKHWDTDRLHQLFKNTTAHEKILIWSCDFTKLWYHVWLRIPLPTEADTFYQFYLNSRVKFERLFSKDSGRRVRGMLGKCKSVELGWDIPKGRPNADETELQTAQRELLEEAGVHASDIHMLYDIKPICSSFEDENTTYVSKYYVAWTDKKIELDINYFTALQIGEISDVQWAPLILVHKMPAQNQCLYRHAKLALRLFKTRIPTKIE